MVRGERIQELIDQRGLSQSELARRIGITQGTINLLIRGRSRGSQHLHKIARVLETSAAYLAGETDDPAPDAPLPIDPDDFADRFGFDLVRKYDIRLSAGGGAYELVPTDGEGGGFRAFDRDWLRHEIRRRPDQLGVFKIVGDSMEPELRDGDTALVDLTVARPGPHALYALRYGDGMLVKRLAVSRDGRSVEIISSNPLYGREVAPIEDVQLVGRVVWIGRRVG